MDVVTARLQEDYRRSLGRVREGFSHKERRPESVSEVDGDNPEELTGIQPSPKNIM